MTTKVSTPRLIHTHCTHAKTPAARARCRAAFLVALEQGEQRIAEAGHGSNPGFRVLIIGGPDRDSLQWSAQGRFESSSREVDDMVHVMRLVAFTREGFEFHGSDIPEVHPVALVRVYHGVTLWGEFAPGTIVGMR